MRRLLLLAVALASPALAHEGHDHGAPPLPPSSATTQRLEDGSLFVPKPAQRTLGIRTTVAERGEFPVMIELNGRVIADPATGGRVQASQPGRIEPGPKGLPRLGQRVVAGEVLAYLRHIEDPVERARQAALTNELETQLDLARRRLRRYEQIEDVVPRREIEATRIEVASLEKRGAAMAASISSREALKAPVSGIVASSQGVAGQVVEAREVLFEIVDLQRLMVEAQAFDPALAEGVSTASAVAQDGTHFALRFSGGGRVLRDQALPLLFDVARGAPPLVLGQPVRVMVGGKHAGQGVALPAGAVATGSSGERLVWVHESAERFRARKVEAAPLDGQRVLVTSGLSGGERVVVQGASLLSQAR